MNILLINHYAGSPEMGMEFRPYYFAREWVSQGHDVHILAASYSHIRRVNPDVDHDFSEQVIDGIHYHWIRTSEYEDNGIKRYITVEQFLRKIWMHSRKIVKTISPDVVICSSTYPFDAYIGQHIKRISRKQVKVIHEVHDMWPASMIEIDGMSPGNPIIRLIQKGEDYFCRKSDYVVSLLGGAKEHFISRGMDADKFVHITNGVVLDEWEHYQQIPEELERHFSKNKENGLFNLCFFGSLQKTYNLEMLIDAVKSVGNGRIGVTFIGPGLDRDELQERTKGYESVFRFFDPIPKKCIPDLFNHIDAVFIGLKGNSLSRFGISMNKLFDSMMGGKPIIYMVDEPQKFVDTYECGITVEGKTQADLERALLSMLEMSEDERALMGENGRRAAKDNFSYKVLAERFSEILNR